MTRAWAAELSPGGVLVNTVAHGPTYIGVPRERVAPLGDATLLKRAAEADEVASMISFLASPRVSYVTRAMFAVDSGCSAI